MSAADNADRIVAQLALLQWIEAVPALCAHSAREVTEFGKPRGTGGGVSENGVRTKRERKSDQRSKGKLTMSTPPSAPKVYHITHVNNLPPIVRDGGLWSDAALIKRGGPPDPIGMGSIKSRRLGLPVKCHQGDYVGGYVPFYFCPRSIMLFLIHCANHPEMTYKGGQGPILHLELDLHELMDWANAQRQRWAFSLSNAGAFYSEFRGRVDQLDEIDWDAVQNRDFRSPAVKEWKQSEFLVSNFVPWGLVRRIGAISPTVQAEAMRNMGRVVHRPSVEVCRSWYF